MSNIQVLPRAKLKSLSLEEPHIQSDKFTTTNSKQASMDEGQHRCNGHNRLLLPLLEDDLFFFFLEYSRTVTAVNYKKQPTFNRVNSYMLRIPKSQVISQSIYLNTNSPSSLVYTYFKRMSLNSTRQCTVIVYLFKANQLYKIILCI